MKKPAKAEAARASAKKAPPTKKLSVKARPSGARGQAEMMAILERLAHSAERLAQAAERLAQATQRTSATGGREHKPERQDETLEGAEDAAVVMVVDEGEEE